MLKKSAYVYLLFLLWLTNSCTHREQEFYSPSSALIENDREIEVQVDRLMLPLIKEGLLGGTILIAKGDDIVFAKGYGSADREKNVPNGPETKFRISSTTKSITAVAVMQLEEKGLLNISDPISNYIDDFPEGEKITLYHLLTHTSGIPSYDWRKCDNKPQKLETVIGWIKELPLRSEPGEELIYSNSGYALLARIIEKVSGMPYEAYLRKHIFLPCGMKNAGLYAMNESFDNLAVGYSRADYEGFEKTTRPAPLGRGDGDLYATAMDLFQYASGMYENRLVSSRTRERMWTPFKSPYGMGWLIDEWRGEKLVYHPGGSLGYIGNMRLFNDGDVVVINLFNSDFLLYHLVEDRLAAIALGKPWQPLFQEDLDASLHNAFEAFSGHYSIDDDPASFSLTVADGNIHFQETGKPSCRAYLLSEDSIYIKEINARILFEQNEDGTPEYVGMFGLFQVTGKRIQEN